MPKSDPDLETARRIHQMIAPGTSFDRQGKVYAYELLKIAAAGIAIFKEIPPEEARLLLYESVS